MSNARRIADLLDSSGDVLGTNLDNVTTYSVGDGGLTTNDFTDADHTKLNAIEASATADQTGAEIKTAYEAEANAYTDTKDTKLSGIATSANNYSHPSGAGNSHIPTGGSVDQLLTNTASGTGTWQDAPVSLPSQTGNANKQLTTDGSTASWADTSITLDSPSITGTLSIDSDGTVTHTIGNWSEELTYVITPTNCTVGSINTSGEFVITHTSGVPSYTIKATTDNLGLDDSSLVTKNMVVKLTAPTISSPADVGTATDVVYTITSTDSNDDKLILDMGSSNFTYSSVSVGTASKVGSTVECIGFTTNNPAVTIQFTAAATYSVTAKSVNIAGTYGDSASSSVDSITITNSSLSQLDIFGDGSCKGLWEFSSNVNDTGGTYNGTLVGTGHAYPSGKFGTCIRWDSSYGKVNIAPAAFEPWQDSISFWYNCVNASQSDKHLIYFYNGTRYYIRQMSGNIKIAIVGNSDHRQISATSEGAWMHVVISRESSTSIKIYSNGSLVSTETVSAMSTSSAYNVHFNAENWEGALDHIRIFDRALTSSEVSTLYSES